MITTGIIKELNVDEGSGKANKCKVEIAYFKTPAETSAENYTFYANICSPGGLYSQYNVGDIVYVGFVNGELSYPVILGNIYQGLSEEYRSFANFDALKVANNVQLPAETQIGTITYDNLKVLQLSADKLVDGKLIVGENNQLVSTNKSILETGIPENTNDDANDWISDDAHIPTTKMIDERLENFSPEPPPSPTPTGITKYMHFHHIRINPNLNNIYLFYNITEISDNSTTSKLNSFQTFTDAVYQNYNSSSSSFVSASFVRAEAGKAAYSVTGVTTYFPSNVENRTITIWYENENTAARGHYFIKNTSSTGAFTASFSDSVTTVPIITSLS